MWDPIARLFGTGKPRPRGFAENLEPIAGRPPPRPAYRPAPADLPFPSTGPYGHRARMRERLLDRGPDSLADYEMLEMLLFFTQSRGDTKPLAKALINRFGSFAGVVLAPQKDLLGEPGISTHTVSALKLVQAASRCLARAELTDRPLLNNWDRLIGYLGTASAHDPAETFRVLYLDSRNRLVADEALAEATPREVIRRALERHATALILVHTRPGRDTRPSHDDLAMTRDVQSAAQALGVVLHDHIILGTGTWTSLVRDGLL